jgi:hypothetical protein
VSEFPSEPKEVPTHPPQRRGSGVAITLIIAATIIALACIASATVILWVFFQNPPW